MCMSPSGQGRCVTILPGFSAILAPVSQLSQVRSSHNVVAADSMVL